MHGSNVMILKLLSEKKGSAFLYVTMAVFVMMLIGGMMISILTYEIRINRITEQRLQAKYLAEAGIEHALLGSGASGSDTVTDAEGNKLYSYDYSISGGSFEITSYGYLNNKPRMKIECSVRDDLVTDWTETPMN